MLDKLTYSGNRANLPDDVELHHGDIAEPAEVARAAAGCDAIVNFAAETHVDRSILSAEDFGRAEFRGTQVLLEHIRATGIRLVQVSTDEVYGDLEAGGSSKETTRCARRARTARRSRPATCSSRRTRAHSASTRRSRAAPTPTARTSIRRSSSRSSPRTRSTASRCRCTATDGRCATGCSSRITAPASSSSCTRARRARSTTSAAATSTRTSTSPGRSSSSPAPTARCCAASPTGRATTAATRSTRRSCAPRLGAAEAVRGGPPRDRRVVPRQPRMVGAHQVRRVPRVLRAAVRRAARRLHRRIAGCTAAPRFIASVDLVAAGLELPAPSRDTARRRRSGPAISVTPRL